VPIDEEALALVDQITGHRSPGRPLPHPRTGKPADFLLTHQGRRVSAARPGSAPRRRTSSGTHMPPPWKGAELHQMHHSALGVNTRCLRRSVRRCGAPRPAGAPCGHGDLGLHGPPGSDATMMRLMPLRGVHHRCACWHRNASGSSRLHRVHNRQGGALPGRRRSCEGRAGPPHHWPRHAPDLATSRSRCTSCILRPETDVPAAASSPSATRHADAPPCRGTWRHASLPPAGGGS
jgi:hypothetical protein